MKLSVNNKMHDYKSTNNFVCKSTNKKSDYKSTNNTCTNKFRSLTQRIHNHTLSLSWNPEQVTDIT